MRKRETTRNVDNVVLMVQIAKLSRQSTVDVQDDSGSVDVSSIFVRF